MSILIKEDKDLLLGESKDRKRVHVKTCKQCLSYNVNDSIKKSLFHTHIFYQDQREVTAQNNITQNSDRS